MKQRTVDQLVRRYPWHPEARTDAEPLIDREWLVTNGLGGYASGTIGGVVTRRYHGLLVAALPSPYGRTVMLNHVFDQVVLRDGTVARLGGAEHVGRAVDVPSADYLREFRLEAGLPVWRYTIGPLVLEKRILMPHRQNTVHLTYELIEGGDALRLELRPAVHFRSYEAPVNAPAQAPLRLSLVEGDQVLSGADALPPLRLRMVGPQAQFVLAEERLDEVLYRVEESRGYEAAGALWSPGQFTIELTRGAPATLVASTEAPEVMRALTPEQAWRAEMERRRRLIGAADPRVQTGPGGELVLAADQFLITPAGRLADAARAWAVGDEVRTVIAGYHWFTDWGRDTMISLEGLTLTTGRHREAEYILRTFNHYVRDGLLPNMFPDGSNEGLYHTADATLWFFHAVHRYLQVTGDTDTLVVVLPTLVDIVDQHVRGTRFGIGVDPADGLLRQGAEGYQLTWMDAKVDGWVVTPRRGKAVEINALWYNALCLLQGWMRQLRGADAAARYAELATRTRRSFNERFWYAEGGYLYDVVDGPEGNSTECRPNQVLAISLDNPVLDHARWGSVLDVVRERLLTPVGLRSLAPGSPDYKPRYFGDLRTRDAAYHQGTVWGWLVGPWIDAWLKVHPNDRAGARHFLDGLVAHLDDFGIGSIAEIFDAEPPYTPRGCIAQAWSVAETLRCWAKTTE